MSRARHLGFPPVEREPYVSGVGVSGYKSIEAMQHVEIRPLTILAGANSSGKSSIMQPLLLLKQTLEATYDPGPLLLDGPNVRFTNVEQFMPKGAGSRATLSVQIESSVKSSLLLVFQLVRGEGHRLLSTTYKTGEGEYRLEEGMTKEQVASAVPSEFRKAFERGFPKDVKWGVARSRCFLQAALMFEGNGAALERVLVTGFSPAEMMFEGPIRRIIHLPGLRGNPRRTYPKTAVGPAFPGVFQDYSASLVALWQENRNARLNSLAQDMLALGLTWKVKSRPVDDTQVELQVGRLPAAAQGGGWDLVNIADVGFGVSQVLPVLVALHAAEEGQMVYIEQPEIHLHPKAQVAMAEVLANAAKRGVRVVAETHGSLLLLGVQRAVAEGSLSPDLVKLHWFQRDEQGCTNVTSADLDQQGRFGDWPEDFGKTELEAQDDYLSAAEKQHANGRHAK